MWIQCIESCEGCGAEVILVTDGRYGFGFTSNPTQKNVEGDTDVVWRDGQSYKLQCPTWIKGDEGRCGTEITFDGEGQGPAKEPYYSLPILEEAP